MVETSNCTNDIKSIDENELLRLIKSDDTIDHTRTIYDCIMQSKREKILKEYRNKIWQGRNDRNWWVKLDGKSHKRKTRSDLEDFIVEYILDREQEVKSPTLKEIYYKWAKGRLSRNVISKSTYDRNEYTFKKHFEETGFGNKKITDIKAIEWVDFIESESARLNLSSKGLSRFREIIKGILISGKRDEYITWSIEDMLNMVDVRPVKKYTEEQTQVFSPDELSTLRDYLVQNLNGKNLAILLVTITGMRPGEVVALKWEDILDNAIKIRRSEIRYKSETGERVRAVVDHPKTEAGYRTIVLSQGNEWILDKMKELKKYPDDYLFRNDNEDRLTLDSLDRRFQTIEKNLRLPIRSLNKLRKTYGSILLDANVDQRFIIKQMGHTNIMTTESSYHKDRRDRDEKSKRLSSIEELTVKIG